MSHSLPGPAVPYFADFVKRMKSGVEVSGEEAVQRYEQAIFTVTQDDLENQLKPKMVKLFKRLADNERAELQTRFVRTLKKLEEPNSFALEEEPTGQNLANMVVKIEKKKRGELVNAFAIEYGQKLPVRVWANKPLAKTTLGTIAFDAADLVLPEL